MDSRNNVDLLFCVGETAAERNTTVAPVRARLIEKKTQARVVVLFQKRLGYAFLGDRSECDNRNIEPGSLIAWRDKTRLLKQGMMQELLTGRVRLL